MSHDLDFPSPSQSDRGSQSVLTFLEPSYYYRLTTMSHYPEWTITSSLQNANKSHWELHLSLVAALLSHFVCKLRTAKSHAWSARLAHLVSVSHTITVLIPGHLHPLSPAMGVGPCGQRRALDLKAAVPQAADGPKLLCPSSVPRETAGNTLQHHLTQHLPRKWLCFHDVLHNEYKPGFAGSC